MLERRKEQDFGQFVSDHINYIKTEKEYWELYLESEIFRSSTWETFQQMYGWGAPFYFIRFRIRGFLRDLFERLYYYFW
jgi:hypothetical protein